MIGTLNSLVEVAACFLVQAGPAMATNIVETLHLPLVITDNDETLAFKLMEKAVSHPRDIPRPTNTDPVLSEDLPGLLLMDLRGRKIFAAQCLRAHG